MRLWVKFFPRMHKYFKLYSVAFRQEFAYRANFLTSRFRNLFQIFLVFYLWSSVFSQEQDFFGYDRARILTYVFGILIVRTLVLTTRATEVAGEIARGDLTNYLVKPINYFYYWFNRDIAVKFLHLIFSFFEFLILFYILRPPFFIQTDPVAIIGFLLSLIIGIVLFYMIVFIAGLVPFWAPEASWGVQFVLIFVVTEFLSGALFPLDIFPRQIMDILSFTPFPYLLFYPIKIYLGQIGLFGILKGALVGFLWILILNFFMKKVWAAGIRVYRAEGR